MSEENTIEQGEGTAPAEETNETIGEKINEDATEASEETADQPDDAEDEVERDDQPDDDPSDEDITDIKTESNAANGGQITELSDEVYDDGVTKLLNLIKLTKLMRYQNQL